MLFNSRRFPPPWSVDDTDACFIVHDADGHALTYVLFRGGAGTGMLHVCYRLNN
jgi:hypothetical protein